MPQEDLNRIKEELNKAMARWWGGIMITLFTIPTLHWWGHPMRNSFEAYLLKEIAKTDFMIHYHIGGGLMGETDLRLRGDGAYDLWTTATPRRKRKSYFGQVNISQVEQVVQDMLAVKLWQVRHLYAIPALDDPEAIISVEAGEQKNQVLLWVSEIRESPPFFSVREQLEALIDDLSRGTGQREEVVKNGQEKKCLESKSAQRMHPRRQFNFLASLVKRVKSHSSSPKRGLRKARETSER